MVEGQDCGVGAVTLSIQILCCLSGVHTCMWPSIVMDEKYIRHFSCGTNSPQAITDFLVLQYNGHSSPHVNVHATEAITKV
jgi:hypothetical protein